MDRVTRLLDHETEDGFDMDEAPDLSFGYGDLTPAEKADYDRRLRDLRLQMDATRRDRVEEPDHGTVIHGPGYHNEAYCGGY